ncbi:MAG TPA: hypothetical protein VMZ53_13320 [Kofleriaceae bacterium]|nr:hypothetical protein [Kofleriaceae bacterium]
MIRGLLWLVAIVAFIWFGATVKLGHRTFFGHVRAIWHTDEAQDLKHGVQEKAGPAVHKLEKGVKAGINAMKDEGSNGSGAGSAAPVHP